MALTFTLSWGEKAHAASGDVSKNGVSVSLNLNGQKFNGTDVVAAGDRLSLQVQYGQGTPRGGHVDITVSENAEFSTNNLSNEVVEKIERVDAHTLRVSFKEDWGSTNQGVFNLEFSLTEVTEAEYTKLVWGVDGKETSIDIIVTEKGHQFGPQTDAFAKGVAPANLNKFVKVEDGKVSLDPAITNEQLTYTLNITSGKAMNPLAVTDKLPNGLAFVADSFTTKFTVWDKDGMNKIVEEGSLPFSPTISGQSFSGNLTSQGPASGSIQYKVKVTDVAALETALQVEHDKLGPNAGFFQISLPNVADFTNGESPKVERSARVTIGAQKTGITGPNLNGVFTKNAEWGSKTGNGNAADDELIDPLTIGYVLKANLREFNDYQLEQNVIIEDVLPEQLSWDTDKELTIGGGLTATKFEGTASDFKSSSQPGAYLFDGQKLYVNVGKEKGDNNPVVINVQAKVNTVDGLTPVAHEPPKGAKRYPFTNTATLSYGGDRPVSKTATSNVVLLPEPGDEGYENPNVFNKTGEASSKRVKPGESAKVKYTFTLKNHGFTAEQLAKSKIVDYLEPEAFDLPENPDEIDLTGRYGNTNLTRADFMAAYDADGNLEIVLSESGKQKVDRDNQPLVVTLNLTTKSFEGKETKTITNKATLFGEDEKAKYWSSTQSESTSYGDEAEVAKAVFNQDAGNGENPWTGQVQAIQDRTGKAIDNPFAYRVTFLPHGTYNNVVISDVTDKLPEGVEFLGFVNKSDLTDADGNAQKATDLEAKASALGNGPIDIGGNLQASYDPEKREVHIKQKEGTRLNAADGSGRFHAHFAVKLKENVQEEVVNNIDGAKAIIKPTKSSVTWEKTDANDADALLAGSEWKITGEDGFELEIVDNDSSTDENPVAGEFKVSGLTPGNYTLEETVAPTGYRLATSSQEFQVPASGNLDIELAPIANERLLGSASWHKLDGSDAATLLEGSEWKLTGPNGFEEYIVDNGELDQDETLGKFLINDLPWGEYTLTEIKAPAGFNIDDNPHSFVIEAKNRDHKLGGIQNERKTGSVNWQKVDSDNAPLGGSEWKLSGPDGYEETIVDNGSHDVAEEAGELTVEDLAWGDYTLTEVKAPKGYKLADGEHTFTLDAKTLTIHLQPVVNDRFQPSIDLEKWNQEKPDSGPQYDDQGVLLNDGYDGDFDQVPGKKLSADTSVKLFFTISNDGDETLTNVAVSDKVVEGSGTLDEVSCVFPDGSSGTTWDGDFEPGTQFECEATFSGLEAGEHHKNTASVTAVGVYTGDAVDDNDDWHAYTEEVLAPESSGKPTEPSDTPTKPGPGNGQEPDQNLSKTGSTALWVGVLSLLLLVSGAMLLVWRQRSELSK